MKTEHIDWIDGLKGVAILGVILIHCGGASLPFPLSNVGDAGKYGVQLFFLISGYLAFLSYANHNKIHVTGGGERESIQIW